VCASEVELFEFEFYVRLVFGLKAEYGSFAVDFVTIASSANGVASVCRRMMSFVGFYGEWHI